MSFTKPCVLFIFVVLVVVFIVAYPLIHYMQLSESFPMEAYEKDLCGPQKMSKFFECAHVTTMNLQDQHTMYKTIKLITELLDQYNISYFLMEGSLLGVIRNKGLVPYDDDFDIGLFEVDRPKVRQIVENVRNTRNGTWRLLDYDDRHWHPKIFLNLPQCVRPMLRYKYCWPFVDLFYLKFNGTHYKNVDTPSFAAVDIHPLRRTKFNDIPVWIPHNWKAVIPYWENAMKTCCTNTYNHKLERKISQRCSVCIPCECLNV